MKQQGNPMSAPSQTRGVSLSRLALVLLSIGLILGTLWQSLHSGPSRSERAQPSHVRDVRPTYQRPPPMGLSGAPGETGSRSAVVGPQVAEGPVPVIPAPVIAGVGVIRGYVRDDFDRPIPGAVVDLFSSRSGFVSKTRALQDGHFVFDGLQGGTYSVRLNTENLPQGVLPPWRQEAGTPGQGNDYQAKKVEMPIQGGALEVELRVFTKSVAWGMVVGLGGEAVENVHVRLQSAAASGQPSSLMAEAHTNALGQFEMEGVYPGRFVIETFPQSATDPFYHSVPAPIPHAIEIFAGGYYDVGVIQLGGGMNSIAGRVVDDEGIPFADLPVIAYPAGSPGDGFRPFTMALQLATATTDASGYYTLDKLPSASVMVYPGADYPDKPLGGRRAAFHVPQQELDLGGSRGSYRADDFVVPRSRPFRVHGQVFMDQPWASEYKVPFKEVSFAVRLQDPEAPRIEGRPSFVTNRTFKVDPETGQYEWLCETPHLPVVLVFTSSRGKHAPQQVFVAPEPNGDVEFNPYFTYAEE